MFDSRVVAENDFLHTLLNKVTTSRGDSGGQGTVLQSQALFFVPSHVAVLAKVLHALKVPTGLYMLQSFVVR